MTINFAPRQAKRRVRDEAANVGYAKVLLGEGYFMECLWMDMGPSLNDDYQENRGTRRKVYSRFHFIHHESHFKLL
jgi:hypothetical protein